MGLPLGVDAAQQYTPHRNLVRRMCCNSTQLSYIFILYLSYIFIYIYNRKIQHFLKLYLKTDCPSMCAVSSEVRMHASVFTM